MKRASMIERRGAENAFLVASEHAREFGSSDDASRGALPWHPRALGTPRPLEPSLDELSALAVIIAKRLLAIEAAPKGESNPR